MIQLLSDSKIGEDNFIFEKTLRKRGYKSIAGCDEVGRGPLAGPVVSAAVVAAIAVAAVGRRHRRVAAERAGGRADCGIFPG